MSSNVFAPAVDVPARLTAARPAEGETMGEVVKKVKRTRGVRCPVAGCGKLFKGSNARTKLGAHTYHAHKKTATSKANGKAADGMTGAVASGFAVSGLIKQLKDQRDRVTKAIEMLESV